jgi:sialic acid synthase SpsE
MGSTITINGWRISPNDPPYVIAELSANHNGSIKNALDLIGHAKTIGADAIKLQTYRPDTITLTSEAPEFLSKMDCGGAEPCMIYIKRRTHLGTGIRSCLIALARRTAFQYVGCQLFC